MSYHVYILYSSLRDRYYIGYTGDDPQERLRKHNTNHKGFSGNTGDWKIVYLKDYPTKQEATKREKEIKSWKSRKMIERLISSTGSLHPHDQTGRVGGFPLSAGSTPIK